MKKAKGLSGLTQRFYKKFFVNEETKCWIWTAGTNVTGFPYGKIHYKTPEGTNTMLSAHRASYMIHKGEIPEGNVVMHTCDNPKCVNPNHLVTGTQQDNINDKVNKGRACGHPSKLSASTVKRLVADKRPAKIAHNDYDISLNYFYKIKRTAIKGAK